MSKRKKIIYAISGLFLILLVVVASTIDTREKNKVPFIEPSTIINEPIHDTEEPAPKIDGVNIKFIQDTYQNTDIVGYLTIPNVMSYPIVQAADNEYYLRRLLNGSYAIKGTPFMDYRTFFGDKKVLIYGHSGETDDFPFLPLHQYDNEAFFNEHSTIYLYSIDKIYIYKVISSYIEASDYDYVNIQSFRGLTWLEHINKLKNKSQFQTDVKLTDDSKILVLQTCSMDSLYTSGKYRLVIGLLVKTEDNIYE